MEDLNHLRMKEKMLLIELDAIRQKIVLLETITTATFVPESENSKTNASPSQTVDGKDSTNPLTADALLKSILMDKLGPDPLQGKTSKLVNDSTIINESSIPVANGSGKESSNPLIPVALGKSKMTILSPTNPSVQDLSPDWLKAVKKEPGHYYVIYKGPHAGIHADWGTTKKFCKEDKVTCKKFKSQESARISLATYANPATVSKTTLARPLIQRKIERRDQRFDVPAIVQEEVLNTPMSIEDFRRIWSKARNACSEDFIHERFYTTDKKTKSLFNFIEGADPELIHEAFKAGLVDNIYPSSNLQELKFFSQSMVEKIKNFRRKVLKARDDPIYLKVSSSIPDWEHPESFQAYHFIEIGLAKNKKEIIMSQPMEDKDLPFHEMLLTVRLDGLKKISEKILKISSETKFKVNYATNNCIITSWSPQHSQEDQDHISKFGLTFMNNALNISSTTRQKLCPTANRMFEGHNCQYCIIDNSVADPSTEESKSLHDTDSTQST